MAPSLDAEARVKAFKQKHQIAYPLLPAARGAAQAWGVEAYPTMFLVGRDGLVKWKGHFQDQALLQAIPRELAVPVPKAGQPGR